jgi:FkbM family methyltransferase
MRTLKKKLRKIYHGFMPIIEQITGIYHWMRTKLFVRCHHHQFGKLIIREKTSDFSVFYKIFIKKEYRLDFPMNPRVILDVGANTGYSSLWFAMNYPSATVYAFEPEKSNFAVLVHNSKKHPCIKAFKYAIWYRNSYLKLRNAAAEKWAFAVQETQNRGESQFLGITLDQVIEHLGIQQIDILKMDIEGAEKRIFEEPHLQWLQITDVIMIELHDHISWGASSMFYKAMRQYGFHTHKQGENIIARKNRAADHSI